VRSFLRKLRLLRFIGDTVAFKFWKKKWEREPCTFELQEYGAAGKPGWATISKPTGEVPNKQECAELFQPGYHYRVLAKSVETGKIVGVVWNCYEPLPGGIEAKPEKEEKAPPQPREPRGPRSPSEWMGEYAKQVADTLEPLAELVEAVRGLDIFGGGGGGQPPANPQQFPPLDFSGKAPWVLHPYIVREIGNQIKDVSDHIMDRLSGLPAEAAKRMQAQAEAGVKAPEEEEEMPLLPNPEEYVEEEKTMEEPETVPSLEETQPPEKPKRRPRK